MVINHLLNGMILQVGKHLIDFGRWKTEKTHTPLEDFVAGTYEYTSAPERKRNIIFWTLSFSGSMLNFWGVVVVE